MIESPWLTLNKLSKTSSSVWTADSRTEFDYSDGLIAEQNLQAILRNAHDKSSLSAELDALANDWVTTYHLSSERANIYRYLDLTGLTSGLELGCGCGAITRYIAETGLQLDAVEGTFQRAEIASLRCQGMDKVTVIHADFNCSKVPEQSYDLVVLNGVLEYAKKFLPDVPDSRNAAQLVLGRALTALKPGGILCLAIENRMGLKYWLGAGEDHCGVPYMGLYGYPSKDGIRTYDRQELDVILSAFPQYVSRYFFPFPDYKMARAILSESYVHGNPNCHAHLYRILSRDNNKPVLGDFNEFLVWQGLRQSEKFSDFANSFFVLISRDQERLQAIAPYDFAHFSGPGRKAWCRVATTKKRTEERVCKTRLGAMDPPEQDILLQNLESDQFVSGPLLAAKWLETCVVRDFSSFKKQIFHYFDFLVKFFENHDRPEFAFDLLPFNIILRQDGSYKFIDQEWGYREDLSPEYILFRALLWFPGSNSSVLLPLFDEFKLATILDFVKFGFDVVSRPLSEETLERYITLEEQFQKMVESQENSDPIRSLLYDSLHAGISIKQQNDFIAQLYWQEDHGDFDERKSLYVQGKIGVQTQTLAMQLPSDLNNIAKLRFDPADRPGFFHILQMRLYRIGKNGKRTELWKIDDTEEIASAFTLTNMYFCRGIIGNTFFSINSDPFMVIDFSEKWGAKAGAGTFLFEVEMDWPKSSDFLVVMDSLGHEVVQQQAILDHQKIHIRQLEEHNQTQADRIYSQAVILQEKETQLVAKETHIQDLKKYIEEQKKYIREELLAKDRHIDSLSTELALMKGTRAWRTAEFVRRTFYYRLRSCLNLGSKSINTLRQEGVRSFLRKSKRTILDHSHVITLGLVNSDYDKWVNLNALCETDKKNIRKEIQSLGMKPLVSIIVPVYNVDQIWLEKTIESVQAQLYENWELCLVDDASSESHIADVLRRYADEDRRIKILLKKENEGIAVSSNAALGLATGEYVGLLDHDDELSVDALYENVRIINQYPDVGLIYSDEDKLDMQGRRVDPFFKPDYSPDQLYSQNYICHFTVMKKSIVDQVGGFRKGYDGSQDHDIILRVIEKSRRVHHIPKILYHWRKIPGSTAAVYDSKSYAWEAGRLAIEDSLRRRHIPGSVSFAKYQGSYRVRRDIIGMPHVSIVIPFKDRADLLRRCLDSILVKTGYENFEIIGVSNNSTEKDVFSLMDSYEDKDSKVRFLEHNVPFNFSTICNYGVAEARGEYVLLLNNDIEILSENWLTALLEHAQRPEVGAVGGKLYYPDNRVQHAGIVVGLMGPAGHPHKFFHRDDVGYYARAHIIHNVSAVTGACMMVAKEKYMEVNGLDEDNFPVAYNDIDFCLKLLAKGYYNVFSPYCEAYHHESVSRGYDDTPEKKKRLTSETNAFYDRWENFVRKGDPWYNPNLSLAREDFSIRLPEDGEQS